MRTELNCLLIALVVQITCSPTNAQTNMVVFDQPQYSFSVRVPSDWKRKETTMPTGYKYVFYNDVEVFAVMIEDPTDFAVQVQKDIEAGKFTEQYRSYLKQEWESKSVKQDVQFYVVTIANIKWLVEMSSVPRDTLGNRIVNRMFVASRVHKGKKYSIQFIGGPASSLSGALEQFKTADSKYFEAILKSFWIY